ncbi:hypothetical protein PGT21_014965 [Puccinia graminis f. sp. tritici]|uniref:Rho-GAP domain-containing protein n=1 Tax=Puccinia graminis f. sp. tritici TaxID=56615 RepID=A0A5B0PS18_PUCGR|nr:hypothetical protein PGT21_014965 [Puccinia graminis f. sp. tritici]
MSSALSELQPPSTKQRWWKVPLFNHKQIDSSNQPPSPLPPTAQYSKTHLNQLNQPNKIFGSKLEDSLQSASVAISMIGQDKKAYIYGFIPVVVAKCGLYLKENGTQVEGIFRISGSTKRMKELQAIFDEAPFYGKDLDWKSSHSSSNQALQETALIDSEPHSLDTSQKPYFSIHDAANVLRRYLMCLPEPLISQSMYEDLKGVLAKFSGDQPKQIRLFKSLISTLNPSSQYLLLYLLDLLAVFANRSDKNLMTANNLAVVFQPALCPANPTTADKLNKIIYAPRQPAPPPPASGEPHPPSAIQQESLLEQESIMKEVKQAQAVLEFMILNQSHFVVGLRPQTKPNPRHSVLGGVRNEKIPHDRSHISICANDDEQTQSHPPSTPRPTSCQSRLHAKDPLIGLRTSDIKRSHTLPSNNNSPKSTEWNQIMDQSVGSPVPSHSDQPPKYHPPKLSDTPMAVTS